MIPLTFIFLFSCCFAYLFLGVYALSKNRNSLINRMFFSICILLSLWSIGYAFMAVSADINTANLFRLVACFGWCFFYSFWVDFAVLIKCENKKWMTNYKRLFYYIPALYFFIQNLIADPNDVLTKTNGLWADTYKQDIPSITFALYSFICAAVGIIIVHGWGKKSSSKREKKQATVIVHASITTYLIGTTIDTVLPFMNIYNYSFDLIVSLILVPSIWYAISKYKMMCVTVDLAHDYIMKTINEPVIIVGCDLLIKYANGAALSKTDYHITEVLGKPFTDMILDTQFRTIAFQNIFNNVLKNNVSNQEINLVKKNKEYVPCLLSGTKLYDDLNDEMGTAFIFYDITDKKKAVDLLRDSHAELEKMVLERTSELENINALLEEEISERQKIQENLKASEEQYKALIYQYQDGIIVCDGMSNIITYNIRANKILGFPDEFLNGLNIKKVLTPNFKYLYDEIHQVIDTKTELSGVIKYTGKDGKEHNIQYTFIPVSYNNQQNLMITFRDITEMLKVEEQKRQMVNLESLGTLAGGIAHDFNNILAGIIGYTQLSLDEAKSGNIRDNLNEILNLGDRARKLVRQILTFSRKSNIKLENVKVIPIIEEIIKMLNATRPSNVQINYKISCESPCTMADSTELQELVMNLCVNSILALNEKGGILDILVEKMILSPKEIYSEGNNWGEFIKISVIDNGCGIDTEIKKRIFEPFFTTRPNQGGTGLGLSVAHGIVQRCGGWIDVESEPGEGSTFTVFLPSAENAIADKTEEKLILTNSSNIRILLVDDEIPILNSIRRILEKRGYFVTSQSNPQKALRLFLENPIAFDIVITDQSMPDISGIELINKLRAARSDIPVILCSGYNIEDEVCYSDGKNIMMLSKPAAIDDYINTIEHALTKKNNNTSL